ncbi:hypothetical protein COT75_03405 [Candidatus Beckwithbacteria bacterium CG10_big_fil_rev_8_21_14_0_10_34_10]|uniref:Uncharacterized protein n=1 Tax=Candidatus Beckwithbacteria bacterium CG10_big_fil_rev_8_21_14_0_10_34_10 TaxID=1974495 RepID=A0A2H0W8T6_9BACT|nr:MAG: hypothetical protein COT75_03405 [Candidatus Beckwithbacteria bacterium CG10_big_fil_rev_8_21_14_0_10_34_10]
MLRKTGANVKFSGFNVKTINCSSKRKKKVNLIAAKHYCGPKEFNHCLIFFNDIFLRLIDSTVPEKKRTRLSTEPMKIVSYSSDKALKALDELIEIVNFTSRPIITQDLRKKYKKNVDIIAAEINKRRSLKNENVILVPLRGGAYLLDSLNVNHKKVIAIDCKRLPLKKKGYFALGMSLDKKTAAKMKWRSEFNAADFHKKHVRIVEACIVSGMTTLGFLINFISNGIKPSLIEINTIAASQQGVNLILKLAKKYNYKVKFVTGGLFYRLGDYYQSQLDELLTLDGKLVIGDIKKYLGLSLGQEVVKINKKE